MECSKCKIEMTIVKATNVIENNKLYREVILKCRNPKCEEYDKEVTVSRELKAEIR